MRNRPTLKKKESPNIFKDGEIFLEGKKKGGKADRRSWVREDDLVTKAHKTSSRWNEWEGSRKQRKDTFSKAQTGINIF